jgi:hypothetical protein
MLNSSKTTQQQRSALAPLMTGNVMCATKKQVKEFAKGLTRPNAHQFKNHQPLQTAKAAIPSPMVIALFLAQDATPLHQVL